MSHDALDVAIKHENDLLDSELLPITSTSTASLV